MTTPMLGMYKGGKIQGGGSVLTMVNLIPEHHDRNLEIATYLLALGCNYHHRLNWNLTTEAGQAAITLPALRALASSWTPSGFTIGVTPVPDATEHYVAEAPAYAGIIRLDSFVAVTPPHDLYAAPEAGDYTRAALRTYIINQGGPYTRIYYGRQINLTTDLKGSADFGSEPPHIIHVALNSTTSYLSVTSADIADAAREFFNWWVPQNRTDKIYAHINYDVSALSDRITGLMVAAIVGGRESSPDGFDCIMLRIHDPATGGATDLNQASLDSITETRSWLS